MHRSAFTRTLIVALLGVAALAPAQEKRRELTVEELYLRDIEFQILREQAFSSDREIKLQVLDELEATIEQGGIDDPDKIEFVLEYLGMEGTTRRVRESARVVNYYPEVRRRAANLLGRLGGEKAKNALISIILTDDEPMVKAEAAYALGVVGLNESNDTVSVLLMTLERENPEMPDNNLAYAVCLALEKIGEKNNGIREPEAYRALVRIAQGTYIKTVRRKALETLDVLKGYQ